MSHKANLEYFRDKAEKLRRKEGNGKMRMAYIKNIEKKK